MLVHSLVLEIYYSTLGYCNLSVQTVGMMFFQEKKSIRPTFSAEHIYGGTLLSMCSNDFICFYDWAECRLIRRIDVNVKVREFLLMTFILHLNFCHHIGHFPWGYLFFGNPFQNLYWADGGDLVAISSDTSFYILKYNVSILLALISL